MTAKDWTLTISPALAEETADTALGLVEDALEDHDDPEAFDHHSIIDDVMQSCPQAVKLAILESFGDRDLSTPSIEPREGWDSLLNQLAFNALYAEVARRRDRPTAERIRELRERTDRLQAMQTYCSDHSAAPGEPCTDEADACGARRGEESAQS